MLKLKSIFIVLLGLLLLLMGRPLSAQDPTPTPLPSVPPALQVRIVGQTLDNETKRLTLRAALIQTDGRVPLAVSLADVQADFGTGSPLSPQSLRLLPPAQRAPLTLLLVVDVTETMPLKLVRNQLPALAEGLQTIPAAQIGVIAFGDDIEAAFPVSDDFAGAAAFIRNLTSVSLPPDTNVVLNGVSAGVNLIGQGDPSRDYALVLVTDAVGTAPDQAALASIAERMKAAKIAFFGIPVPEGVRRLPPDLSVPQFFARETGGFAYIPGADTSDNGISVSLATGISGTLEILRAEYEMIFDLSPLQADGLQGDLPLTLHVNTEGVAGRAQTRITFIPPSVATVTLQFEGLSEGDSLSGIVPLSLLIAPPLPPAADYVFEFTVDGQPLICFDPTVPFCEWTTQAGQVGARRIEATLRQGGTPLAATALTVNVFREDISFRTPTTLFAQVEIEGDTAAYNGVGELVELYAQSGGRDLGVVARALLDPDGTTTLVWDVQNAIFAPDPALTVSVINLRYEVWDKTQNLLLGRGIRNGLPATRAGGGFIDVNFDPPPDLTRQPILLQGAYQVLATVQNLPPGATLVVSLGDEILAESPTSDVTVTLDSATLPPALYPLVVAVRPSAGAALNTAGARRYALNLYRPLTSVRYSSLVGDMLVGYTEVEVNAAGFVGAGLAVLYVDGREVGRALVEADGFARLDWDLESLYFIDESTPPFPATVRVDLLDAAAVTLLGRAEAQYTLGRGAGKVILEGLPPNPNSSAPLLVQGTFDLLVRAQNPTPNTELVLLLNDELVASTAEAELRYTLDTDSLPPATYTLVAGVARGGEIGRRSRQVARLNVYRTLRGVEYSAELNGAIEGDTDVLVNTAGLADAGTAILYVQEEEVTRGIVGADGFARLAWAVEALYFSDPSAPDELSLPVRVDVLDEAALTLLGRYEAEVTVRPAPVYELTLEGLNSGDFVFEPVTLSAVLSPLPRGDLTYTFTAQAARDESRTYDLPTTRVGGAELVLDPTTSVLPPGNYLLTASASLDGRELASTRLTLRLILPAQVRGDFLSAEVQGRVTFEVDSPPEVRQILAEFLPNTPDVLPITLVNAVPSRELSYTQPLDLQALIFQRIDPKRLEGTLRVTLNDSDNQPIYLSQRPLVLMDSGQLSNAQLARNGIQIALQALALLFLATVALRARRKIRKSLRRQRGEGTQITASNLLVCYPPRGDKPHKVLLLDREVYTVGRQDSNMKIPPDINIPDRSVSARTGRIELVDGVWYLTLEKAALANVTFKPYGSDKFTPAQGHLTDIKKRRLAFREGDLIGLGLRGKEWIITFMNTDDSRTGLM